MWRYVAASGPKLHRSREERGPARNCSSFTYYVFLRSRDRGQCLKKSAGRVRDQTSLLRGLACPPATQSLSLNTNIENSCRSFHVTVDFSCVHSLPSPENHTSPQFVLPSFDQPPATHIRFR